VNRVFLVGFMGAGKSTVGRMLADRLGKSFVDLDDRIEERAGATISEIFEAQGEEGFRVLESEAVASVAEEDDAVVACGGGAVLSDENRRVMRDLGCVVYLAVTPEIALARVGGAESRPLLAGRSGAVATSLLDARKSLYESVADITVDTSGLGADEVATSVLESLSTCGRFAHE
jgi:shikimate kinase